MFSRTCPLPCREDGENPARRAEKFYAFTAIKLKLEFDWVRLWGKDWGKKAKKDASAMRREGDTFTFEEWVRTGRTSRLKEFVCGKYRPIEGLSADEMRARTEWNMRNRRVIDVRPVTDRRWRGPRGFEVSDQGGRFCRFARSHRAVYERGQRGAADPDLWKLVRREPGHRRDFDPEHFEDWER